LHSDDTHPLIFFFFGSFMIGLPEKTAQRPLISFTMTALLFPFIFSIIHHIKFVVCYSIMGLIIAINGRPLKHSRGSYLEVMNQFFSDFYVA